MTTRVRPTLSSSALIYRELVLTLAPADMAAFTDSLSRLPLGKRANAAAARALRAEMGDMIDDVEMDVRDDDAEMREWEEAQIRRGGEGRRTTRDEGAVKGKGKGPYRPAPSASPSLSLSLVAFSRPQQLTPPPSQSPNRPLSPPSPPSLPASRPPSRPSRRRTRSTRARSPTLSRSAPTSTSRSASCATRSSASSARAAGSTSSRSRSRTGARSWTRRCALFPPSPLERAGEKARRADAARPPLAVPATREDRGRVPRHPARALQHRLAAPVRRRRRRRRPFHGRRHPVAVPPTAAERRTSSCR